MSLLIALCFLFLGLFIGSFLNVVILRWGTDKSIVTGRSVCAHTGNILPWYDLIPVISFIALRGKSRFSKQALSLQYPLVELITGVLFLGAYWKFFANPMQEMTVLYIVQFVLTLVILCLLVVIAFYDLRTKIIPDPLVYSFILLAGIIVIMQGMEFSYVIAGPVLWAPFAFLWFVSRGTWMGYGDAKFAIGMGWFLGLLPGLSAVILSFWIGAAVSLALLGIAKILENSLSFLPKGLTIKSEVPFAPFLVLGTLLVFFFDIHAFLLF